MKRLIGLLSGLCLLANGALAETDSFFYTEEESAEAIENSAQDYDCVRHLRAAEPELQIGSGSARILEEVLCDHYRKGFESCLQETYGKLRRIKPNGAGALCALKLAGYSQANLGWGQQWDRTPSPREVDERSHMSFDRYRKSILIDEFSGVAEGVVFYMSRDKQDGWENFPQDRTVRLALRSQDPRVLMLQLAHFTEGYNDFRQFMQQRFGNETGVRIPLIQLNREFDERGRRIRR